LIELPECLELVREARAIITEQPDVARTVYYDSEKDCYCTVGALVHAFFPDMEFATGRVTVAMRGVDENIGVFAVDAIKETYRGTLFKINPQLTIWDGDVAKLNDALGKDWSLAFFDSMIKQMEEEVG
jgi:hypothetical protein